MGCTASIARTGAVDVAKRQEDVEPSGYSTALSTAHSRFSLTISRTCTEGPINASNSQHPASRKAATTSGIAAGHSEPHGALTKSPATTAGGATGTTAASDVAASGSGPAGAPGSPTPSSSTAGSSAPGSPQSPMPAPGSSPVSPLDLSSPGVGQAGGVGGFAGGRGAMRAAANKGAAACQQEQQKQPAPQAKPMTLPGLTPAATQGSAGSAGEQAASPFATSRAAAADGSSNGSDLSSSGRAPAPVTPPASSVAACAAASAFAGGMNRLDSASSSAGGSPARLPSVPHPVGGFFDSRPGSPALPRQQAAGSSTSASAMATAASGDMQATETGGGAASGGAAGTLSAPPRPAWARKLLGEQLSASGGASALSSPLSSEAAVPGGREALSRQSSGLHAGGMLLPPIHGVPLPPAAAAALMSSAGSSRLNSSRVLPALGNTSTSGVSPVAPSTSTPASAAPPSPVQGKSVFGPVPAQLQTLPHPATVVTSGTGHSTSSAAASAPVPVPTPAAAALQSSGQNTPHSLSSPPASASIQLAAASTANKFEPTAVASSPPHPSAAAPPPSLMPRASAPPVMLPTGSSAAAPAAPSLAAAAAALSSSPSGGGGRGGSVVATSPASLTAGGTRGSRTAGLSAVRGGLVTLAYVESFLKTHVLGRGAGSGLMTTRQVVEHIIAPACSAAGGCRFPEAPPPAAPAAATAAAGEHALGIPPRAATSPCTLGGGSTSASGVAPSTSADSGNGSSSSSSHPSSTSSSGVDGGTASGSRPVGGPSLHLRDWAACSLPGGGASAGSAAAAAAAPSGRYCYVVHAADCCFADVVALLRSHLMGVPPEEAVLWLDIFALPQEPEPSASAASSPSGHHALHHTGGFTLSSSGASFSSALPAGRAARVDAARAAIAHAGSVLLCLLPPSAGCPAYATRTTSARHLQLQARLAPALALPGGSEDPAVAGGAEAGGGGLPLPLRRTWCLWELSTALRLRGPSAVVVLEGAGCGDGVSAAVPEDGGATASAAAAFPVPRATCGGGLWLAAGVSRARSLSLTRSQLGGTLAPTLQHAADRAALIADMVAHTVQCAASAAPVAGCADLGGCAAGDVEAVESALRLFFALAPTGYGEELAELALRAAPEQAPAARGAPALPGSGPGGSSAAATANAPGAGGKSCWRFEALWAALSDEEGPRCVVVAAPPGAGKSTFAAALACPPPTPPTAPQPPAWRSVAALHLCHAADGRRQDALRVVRSLAFQLAARFPACRAVLAAEMMSASASCSHPVSSAQPPSVTQLEDAVEALLVKPLAALAVATAGQPQPQQPPLVLLIDGVDERGPPTGAAASKAQPQPPPPASPSGSELCSPRPPSTPPRPGGGSGRPCPVRSPSGATSTSIPSSPSGGMAAAAAAAAGAASASSRGPFPLAPLVAVLLRRLPSHVRLLLTAEQPPKCDASSASAAAAHTGTAALAAGLDLTPVPDGVASAESVAEWLQITGLVADSASAAAANGGRRTAAAGSQAAAAAPAGCRVLPLTSLRDDFALAASLHQQLLLRAGAEGALPLTAALLVRGGPRLAFYVTCLRLHALPSMATAPERLPLSMEAAWEMLFEQEWRAGGVGAVGLADVEKTTARRLLAVLAAAQEPLPVALLAALGLAAALPLLPGWGTGLFVEDLPQRRVRVASGPLAAWLRGGAAAAGGKAAAAYGADVAAGHAILAAQLYDMCGRAAVAASGAGPGPGAAGGAGAALPGAIAAYAARHLHTHLAAAIALAPASPQLQQLQQKLQQLEQAQQQPKLQASTSGRLRLTLPAEGGSAAASGPRTAPAPASTPSPVAPAGTVAALKQQAGAQQQQQQQQQPLPSLSQLDAWAAHLGMPADTPRTSSLTGSSRKQPQEPPRGPPAAIAV
ncbi:hypothetical protein HYH02_011204 [Chlamydomonas schloesseri]|uniref:Nephrocystin 3-like N-terminal domain-containing protein n=1 Tax=Chlamydomonas schloesseri TaxID=2026947 RepID=A0A835W1Y0_9CHLO|nr:hypothetical protein HYH02_011204 [Chlamydomonas schloesseri]|eukprot:KAG2437562.1 hypothetical protein HYH02_011204 [Chlamydomonas schloesseri]